jgi:hypothetical protein
MTRHKQLKKLVRERMDRTGESYTTARRQVLAQAPDTKRATRLPEGIIAGYRRFGASRHHDSGLLANLLAAHRVLAPHTGAPYTEAMIAGLGGGIGFMYAVFAYRDVPPLLTIVAQHHPEPWAPAALGRLGIAYREEHSGKAATAVARLREHVASGTPVLVTLDRGRVPWHGLEPGLTADPYQVVVAGAEDGGFWIDDEGPQPRRLEVTDLTEAWSAHRKGRHAAITIAEPTQREDLPGAIRRAISATIAHLTGPVLGNSFDVNFGFSGMAKLAAQLRDTRTKAGWAKRFGDPIAFFHGVRRLYECLELEYTAPGATRPVYADFLDEAAPLAKAEQFGEAAELFRRSGRQWSALAALAQETTAGLGAYTELAEQRLALMFGRGSTTGTAQAQEIRELNARLEVLAAEYAAGDPLGDDGRRDLFARMAELVEECLELEREAVRLLKHQ